MNRSMGDVMGTREFETVTLGLVLVGTVKRRVPMEVL